MNMDEGGKRIAHVWDGAEKAKMELHKYGGEDDGNSPNIEVE
jgi:hypothetical protein